MHRDNRIWTCDILLPKQTRYQTVLYPEKSYYNFTSILKLCLVIYSLWITIVFYLFIGYLGFEPRTYRLKAEYSTIELVTLLSIKLYFLLFCLIIILFLCKYFIKNLRIDLFLRAFWKKSFFYLLGSTGFEPVTLCL